MNEVRLAGGVALIALVALSVWQAPSHAQAPGSRVEYTAEQATLGKGAYDQHCSNCHGSRLDNGTFAPSLKGAAFRQKQTHLERLLTAMSTTMPPSNPGSLGAAVYTQILAYVLQANDLPAGPRALPSDTRLLASVAFPGGSSVVASDASSAVPKRATPLDRITPVTDQHVAAPAPGDWLTWRRAYNAQGFSPLAQINKGNVRHLRSAWTWSLPVGTNESIPLVRDGVMFVFGSGDRMQALDAATGDLLWQYIAPPPTYKGPRGAEAAGVRRGIAVHGSHVYFGTSDVHVVALDVKTGTVVWDQVVGDPAVREGIASGPLVARGKVMIGTTGTMTGAKPGGPKIVGLDAETGTLLWQVNTIAQPGEPGGNSWNGVPVEKRTGASVWTTGSYDAELNLAFFGTGNTYDTGPLTDPVNQPGVSSELLYTNSTLAINPDTGKLVWHYQHHDHEIWDMDWAFERLIVKLPVAGRPETVVLTAGKLGIFDALYAQTGRYLFSIDLGLQTLVSGVDPETGRKIVSPERIPRDGKAQFYCPSTAGTKSWIPSAYNPETKIGYLALVEACTDLQPSPGGPGTGALTSGFTFITSRARPDSDGNFGRVQAINFETRETIWTARHHAPETSGVLATAGGLVFAGSLDRFLRAYDDATGEVLWQTRLNDVLSSPPISFTAKGKQYIGIVAGRGGFQVMTHARLVPDIVTPTDRTSMLWVFEVPDDVASGR